MIKFYEFPSTDTLVVLDTEKQLAALFSLEDIKSRCLDFTTWWGNDNINNYMTNDLEETLDELTYLYD